MPTFIKYFPHQLITLLFLSLSFLVKAQSEAHVHGLATLMMAMEGNEIEIRFESPAANIIGFEHQATSEEEIQAVEHAETVLGVTEELFSIIGSSCSLEDMTLDFSAVIAEEDHDDHAHEEDHDSHAHEEDHDSHAHEEDHANHSEIVADYHYLCDNIARITSVTTSLFAHFPALEKIDALWVTETNQGAQSLSAENTTINLR